MSAGEYHEYSMLFGADKPERTADAGPGSAERRSLHARVVACQASGSAGQRWQALTNPSVGVTSASHVGLISADQRWKPCAYRCKARRTGEVGRQFWQRPLLQTEYSKTIMILIATCYRIQKNRGMMHVYRDNDVIEEPTTRNNEEA